jgi:hypothetical protein
MKSGVPLLQAFDIAHQGLGQPRAVAPAQRHPHRRRNRLQPVAGLLQAPGSTSTPVLQPGRGRRAGRYSRQPARPHRHLQGKDPRHQGQDQVGAVLPGRRAGGRGTRHLGDDAVRHSRVQERVFQLRRRPAGADLIVIAMSDFFVAYWYIDLRARSRPSWPSPGATSARRRCRSRSTAGAALPVIGADHPQGHRRALDAHAVDHVRRRRAAGGSARFGRRRCRQPRLLMATSRSRARSAPAPA